MEWDSFFELFQPGYKHLREERDRKRLEAQVPATGAPPFGIDLDAGVARFSLPRQASAEDHLDDNDDSGHSDDEAQD